MNTNENIDTTASEDVTVLGIASVETQGGPLTNEVIGGFSPAGISQD
ncbi:MULTISPECIES: benenodin family lasso peptide [Rhodanobacter]|uniref:Benenodin family lasso peptide n=1 Tax=Rhodanobacter hydrolyticus TaxID=2250595 RepID=A0ABW8JAT8_9GAMM|nr:benenodin family lasso peptide [Rhodanobacter sp. 7MK24]MBD8881994.1 benenodin family lasso peptide [Rhodanobacter sp. 7MK24]